MKLDILKVVEVWRSRKVYTKEFTDSLFDVLIKTTDIQHSEIIKSRRNKLRVKDFASLSKGDKGGSKAHTVLDKSRFSPWLHLADSLQQSKENKEKLAKLEKKITSLLSNDEELDEVEIQCKLKEYQMTVMYELEYSKVKTLKAASTDWHSKLENQILEQLVCLDKIDRLVNKVEELGQKLETSDDTQQ